MQNNLELVVVIPVFNEERNIVSLIHDWQQTFLTKNITPAFVVVNDGSTDNSYALLKNLQQSTPDFKIISHSNRGHGPSLLVAYEQACSYEWVFQIDSDHEYETLPFADLWDHRHSYDFLLAERKEKAASIARRFISAASKFTVHILYGKKVNDVNSPYRLMRGAVLKSIIEKMPSKSFAPNILITGFFTLKQMQIYRTPVVKRRNNVSRKSRLNFYFAKGCVLSILQTIQFRLKL